MVSFEAVYLKKVARRVAYACICIRATFLNVFPQTISFYAYHSVHNDYFCSVEVCNKVYKIICARLYCLTKFLHTNSHERYSFYSLLNLKNSSNVPKKFLVSYEYIQEW